MVEARPELESASIVIRGHFNPAIITHGWLLAQKLISSEDFLETKPRLATPDISNFEAPWFECNATKDALQLSSDKLAETDRMRDIAIGILRALPHTPVAALGINHDYHFKTATDAQWHKIGDTLAPKEPWSDTLKLPGTLSLSILAARQDDQSGRVQVTVQPSNRIRPYGVYVGYNDHFALIPDGHQPSSRDELFEDVRESGEEDEPSSEKNLRAITVLESHWSLSLRNARAVMRRVMYFGN
ncbi:hypothetical protein [Pedococcus sp. 5OH_020]|uniref:hypothetical protein n=1 Tax=Pedococcus sp. 5OH_020 TaxID=2989814 RepID=UPI0022E9E90C|nr:hypothetical protein [Pedococcus sp. 5OH_020]